MNHSNLMIALKNNGPTTSSQKLRTPIICGFRDTTYLKRRTGIDTDYGIFSDDETFDKIFCQMAKII